MRLKKISFFLALNGFFNIPFKKNNEVFFIKLAPLQFFKILPQEIICYR
jgi:hypothetical protein